MNEIVKRFPLVGDTFMSAMHLIQPGFTCSASGQLTKNKERIQKCKEKGDWQNIYQIKLDKAYFEHDMVYINFKDLTRRTASHKILRDKVFNIGENPKYDGYQRGLASVVHKFFDAKTSAAGIKNENMSNEELEEETHKPIIRKFKKRKLYSPFIYNI